MNTWYIGKWSLTTLWIKLVLVSESIGFLFLISSYTKLEGGKDKQSLF